MVREVHLDGAFRWPEGRRVAVTLNFDFQGGEDVRPDADGIRDHEKFTQAEYGPNTAVWRILRILEEEGFSATIMTCGAIAERYPEAVKAIVAHGHEVAGHGYRHEVARKLSRDQESEVMRRMKAAEGVWFATGGEVARWRRDGMVAGRSGAAIRAAS